MEPTNFTTLPIVNPTTQGSVSSSEHSVANQVAKSVFEIAAQHAASFHLQAEYITPNKLSSDTLQPTPKKRRSQEDEKEGSHKKGMLIKPEDYSSIQWGIASSPQTPLPLESSSSSSLPIEKATLSFAEKNQETPENILKKKKGCIKAIQRNPLFALPYLGLAETLPLEGEATLRDGTKMSQLELLLKAVDLAPELAKAYCHLGVAIAKKKSIELLNKSIMTQEELFVKAIGCAPKLAEAYLHLSEILPEGGCVKLPDGTIMTKEELLQTGLDLRGAL